jgi:hypothetical protein
MKKLRQVIHRNGVVEFDDPLSGRHMVVMDGLTVESNDDDALAIVSIASIVTCGSCFKRWIEPVENYRNGWGTCPHCKVRLFHPPLCFPATSTPKSSRIEPILDAPKASAGSQ